MTDFAWTGPLLLTLVKSVVLLVVLLCLELMLNGANLALIAFSRMWGNGDGQILALVVMTVAACEVCIGLGMIVAIYRRKLPIDVDELRELQG